MKSILVTGANGFAGSHLVDFLLKEGHGEVFGLVRSRRSDKHRLTEALSNRNFQLVENDLSQPIPTLRLVEAVKPDFIFHLAAQSNVPESWQDPDQTVATNVLGAIHLLEGVQRYCREAKLFICGTAEEYGLVPKSNGPIREDYPLSGNNPYGASKVAQENFSRVYQQSYGLQVCLARPFAHEGPRRGAQFAIADLPRQIVAIIRGAKPPIIDVGTMDTVRDYMHIADMVRLDWELMQDFVPGEAYNICTGVEHSIQEMLDIFLDTAELTGKVEIRPSPKLTRPTQASYLVGNPGKLHQQISARPEISVKQLCADILTYWSRMDDPFIPDHWTVH